MLARAILKGKIKGFKNHPQLIRFKKYEKPIKAINSYLFYVFIESQNRGYNFDKSKIRILKLKNIIHVTEGQIKFEFEHLLKKLEINKSKRVAEQKKKNAANPPKRNHFFLQSWDF